MDINKFKCKLGLHDWEYTKVTEDGLIFYNKNCIWCDETDTTKSYPIEKKPDSKH